MPAKALKMHSGTRISVKSILLSNGNLLIPARMDHDRGIADWVEVAPGTSEYKRWIPRAESEPDPRDTEEYKAWKNGMGL